MSVTRDGASRYEGYMQDFSYGYAFRMSKGYVRELNYMYVLVEDLMDRLKE
jgi:hypothetical protein